jgi:hypothetical protein
VILHFNVLYLRIFWRGILVLKINKTHQFFYFLVVDLFILVAQTLHVLAHGVQALDHQSNQVVRVLIKVGIAKHCLNYL